MNQIEVHSTPAPPGAPGTMPDAVDLAARNVLVRCRGSLGDTIQFARFLPALRSRTGSVTVEVQSELFALLATMPGPDRLIPFRPDYPVKRGESEVSVTDLARVLRLDAESVPVPYIDVPPKPLCLRTGLNVGLCWRAGDWDARCSVPLAALRAACDAPRAHAWSLQYRSVDEADAIPLHGAVPPGADVMSTASAIAGLDLVVTVDTMIAHLAGAIGAETWLLLRRDCDVRWLAGRDTSPWYPTMRLYRQTIDGDWSVPLARLAADIELRAAAAVC